MKKKWLIASFKSNEIKRVKINLLNQKFEYYLPKVIIKKFNSKPKEEVLFPGYIFVNTCLENYSTLQYTFGIKSIIKFGQNIAYISNEDINAMKMAEQESKIDPIIPKIHIGQDAIISNGSFKGSIVKVCSLPSRERVKVLLNFLGCIRRVTISTKNLTL